MGVFGGLTDGQAACCSIVSIDGLQFCAVFRLLSFPSSPNVDLILFKEIKV